MYRDFFVSPPTRFIGYCFAIYEAMKSVLRSNPERAFVFVGSAFIFLHALDEAQEAGDAQNAIFVFIDTLIFEALASVVIPIVIAKTAHDLASHVLNDLNIHYQVTHYGPSFVALLCILLVSKPLDEFIHKILSKTIRPLYL